jgi:hypothetical protein
VGASLIIKEYHLPLLRRVLLLKGGEGEWLNLINNN